VLFRSLWVAYGFLLKSWPIIGSNIVCLLMSGAILALKWRFRGSKAEPAATRH